MTSTSQIVTLRNTILAALVSGAFLLTMHMGNRLDPLILVAPLMIAMAMVVVTDIQVRRIPHILSVIVIITGLSRATFYAPQSDFQHFVLGAIIGGGVLLLLGGVFQRKLSRRAIGGGDVMLVTGLGSWVGWAALPILFLISSAAASLIVVFWAWFGRSGSKSAPKVIPFGPFLVFATLIILIWGVPYWMPYTLYI